MDLTPKSEVIAQTAAIKKEISKAESKLVLPSSPRACVMDPQFDIPLNLSPKPTPPNLETEKRVPQLLSGAVEAKNELKSPSGIVSAADPATSLPWNSWPRTPYLFPGILPPLPIPPLYPLTNTLSGTSLTPHKLIKSERDVKTSESKKTDEDDDDDGEETHRNFRNTPMESVDGPLRGLANHISSAFRTCDRKESNESPTQQYQIKWTNHSSKLISYISSLQGDVATSDTIITARDGTTFYAHRLVLASASPFFSRTLKSIPKDQQAVVVIPKVASRSISTILTFCYTGIAGIPPDDLQPVLELAEDLEISGFLVEKQTQQLQLRFQPSPSSVFRFTPPSSIFPPEYSGSSSRIATPPYTPLLFPPYSPVPSSAPPSSFRREREDSPVNYSQHSKRIKSESDMTSYESKRRAALALGGYHPSSKSQVTSGLHELPSSSSAAPMPNPFSNDHDRAKPKTISQLTRIIPRHVGAGSRVLLWRFLLELLHDQRYTPYYIRWLDRQQGIFRIMESDKVAQLWGLARKNDNMTYEKMSRGMRTYYKRGILFHLDGTKLIYRFNIQEPEIQHQLRYHELMYQRNENSVPSHFSSEQSSPLHHLSPSSNHSPAPATPSSDGEKTLDTHERSSGLNHHVFGLSSLFNEKKNKEFMDSIKK